MPPRTLREIANVLPGYIRERAFRSVLSLPYGRVRQKKLLRTTDRVDDHTYTAFRRSPAQLDAFIGPVLDHVRHGQSEDPISINIFACSTGAEAYTLASELTHRRPDLRWKIHASDLHEHTVDQARRGAYSVEEIEDGPEIPQAFLQRTFDRVGDEWVIREPLRKHVSFERIDLLAEGLEARVAPADVVFIQNVLFHMPPPMARRAFAAAIGTMKPRSALFIDGMEIDMRVELTEEAGLRPLDYRIREIYEYSRRHVAPNWWDFYWGSEPYWRFARDKKRRYATVFLKG